jgi:protein MPE1
MNFVHYKFKSQNQPSKVVFDGTGISVFDLKRDIITTNKLGTGTDFDLKIYEEASNQEYLDDTTLIPRATSVIVRRMPAARHGKGTAARYVVGKGPTRARPGANKQTPSAPVPATQASFPNGVTGDTEDSKIHAMFAASSQQWAAAQEKMATGTRIYTGIGKPAANVPEGLPPHGYVCYRCGEKGHWIQACPTLNDPTFDHKTRVKRTTGIPRSFLKVVDKPTHDEDGVLNVMIDPNGEYVVAQPDR